MDKLEKLVLVILAKLEKETFDLQGLKKLAKLLYFVDFYSYKERGEVIGTSQYIAYQRGPMPKYLYKVLEKLESEGVLQEKKYVAKNVRGGEYTYKAHKIVTPVVAKLSDAENEFVTKVYNKYRSFNGKTLEDLSHAQAPWNSVNLNEEIPINTAFLLPDLEQRQHGND